MSAPLHDPLPGWSADLLSSLPPGTRPGRLARVDRSAYDVLTEEGTRRLPADPPGLTVGDWLAVTDDGVAAVLPRRTLLSRGSASGESTSQPLAANVDVVLVCVGLSSPVPVRRVERLLTLAWQSGAVPVVVLTKADLCDDVDAVLRRLAPHTPGVEVAVVSAETGDLAALARHTRPGTTLALLGASGAGKSTLLNALAGGTLMATGDVRDVDGKGRHTTSHRQLFVLPSGAVVVDTPGLRGVALTADGDLSQSFSDVEELAAACRFADCAHATEPGCALLASIAAGDLAQARVDSWRHLQRELAFQARRSDVRLRAEQAKVWKTRAKEQRSRGRLER
ncbi:MAG: ribosome small subunit-dependent GTPase [Frankiales bacterium]|nr:ribosome small subunit-dependent GTPase [Frankiales bacterium]